jgi:purine-binding chemotaxis protein CheW
MKGSNEYQATPGQMVVFTVNELLFAIPLEVVVTVIHSVEIRKLPKCPEIISGIINVKGQIIPVVDIRKRFGEAAHEIELSDRLIITDTRKRRVAIWVDAVIGIRDFNKEQITEVKNIVPFAEYISGVAKVTEGLVLIYDLDQFLSLDEEVELDQALNLKIE